MKYMEMNFCRRCGSELTNKQNGLFVCKNGHNLFTNPAPCVGIFFLNENNEVLLSVRGIEPFKGMLDSFGGFVDDQETSEQAAERELQEELGLTPDQYEPLTFLCTEIGYYPYQGENRSLLGTFYWSRLKPGVVPAPADDVSEIATVSLHEVDLSKLDNIDVRSAIQKLQKLFV